MTNLFFDDYRILSRDNVIRQQGKPEMIAESVMKSKPEECFSAAVPSITFDPETGVYTMYINAFRGHDSYGIAFTGTDLIHWQPRNTARQGHAQWYEKTLTYENQYLSRYFNGEMVCVIRDDHDIPERRYKAIVNKNDYYGGVDCLLITSPDGICWEEDKGVYCHNLGTEGIGSAFWSEAEESWILALRPFVGERRIAIYQTKDFKTFTKPMLAMWADAMDAPLVELYGLRAFAYKGWNIGVLHLYHTCNENRWKFKDGKMDCQLAYSTNGVHWQRFLRSSFIANEPGISQGMIMAGSPIVGPDGDIYILAACSEQEHGYFSQGGAGAVVTYKLREDGFACLKAEPGKMGRIFTRTVLHRSGQIDFNIRAKHATWALYDHEAKILPGYSHEDCVPFSGDEKHYVPQFAGGKTIADLKDKVFSIELCFSDGEIYGYSGDFINVSQMEVQQYLVCGRIPNRKGQN